MSTSRHLFMAALVVGSLLPDAAGQAQVAAGAQDARAPQATQAGNGYRLTVNANIVLTNVVVRDKKSGAVIRDLKATDFQILENGKPQHIASFDYQNV
ncbi:MAG: hypothetical protein INR62_08690, partial [Rhodospirillales bacterium]|nr:hypothetical protein [Acetobacter sp.]